MIFPAVEHTILDALGSFDSIPDSRREVLLKMAKYVTTQLKADKKAELVYICTHNSRRSHFGQIWAQTAAAYYNIPNVFSYSGGTEATAFNPNAIKAAENGGFSIVRKSEGSNPHYEVQFGMNEQTIRCFSKKYDDDANPKEGFCAIMTCTEADGDCPIVQGATVRISTPYNDPKAFDNTSEQDVKYRERFKQIGTETLYAFSQINSFFK